MVHYCYTNITINLGMISHFPKVVGYWDAFRSPAGPHICPSYMWEVGPAELRIVLVSGVSFCLSRSWPARQIDQIADSPSYAGLGVSRSPAAHWLEAILWSFSIEHGHLIPTQHAGSFHSYVSLPGTLHIFFTSKEYIDGELVTGPPRFCHSSGRARTRPPIKASHFCVSRPKLWMVALQMQRLFDVRSANGHWFDIFLLPPIFFSFSS